MIIFITIMVLTLLLGTFALNLHNTKTFLQEQLQSHAQDTATSLGLSLSTIPDPEDTPSMETMINAVFDRGYYQHISLNDMVGKEIYSRQNAKSMEQVPDWFINNIPLETPSAEALIQAGWIPIGTLTVSSHAGYAYIQLWQTATNLLYWFAAAALIAILIAVSIIRMMLRPLKKIEKQAEAVVKKQYIFQDDLPSTIEFRQVVTGMNAMISKLRSVFERDANAAEKLQKMAYQDSVTGWSNRRHFEMLIDSVLDPQQECPEGVICLLRINNLKEFNDQFGYPTGDKLVQKLSKQLASHLNNDETIYARLNGTELVALVPKATLAKLNEATTNIALCMPDILQELQAQDSNTSISIGYTDYQPGQARGPLLGQVDFAVEQAKNAGQNSCYYYDCGKQSNNEDSWEDTLNQAINEKRFVLFQQNSANITEDVHSQELFLRLKDSEGVIRSAGYFMPAVEQNNLMGTIDKLVLQMTLRYLSATDSKQTLAVNLSKEVVENFSLQDEVLSILKSHSKLLPRLAIELPERLIVEQKGLAWPFLNQLKELNIKVGIDHLGSRLGNMLYLQDLHPNYVKLDASFTKGVDHDSQTREYISSLCELTENLDIDVIAMAVENQEQIEALQALGVKYFQGYYLGAPSAL